MSDYLRGVFKRRKPTETFETFLPNTETTQDGVGAIYRIPANPKDVRESEALPKGLPTPDANVHDVRFFLFHVLTYRKYRIAKHWPQWVLETVAHWQGDGRALRELEGNMEFLCPLTSIYVKQLDGKKAWQSGPSPDCRVKIGQALRHTIDKLKAQEGSEAKIHQEWLAMQRGRGHNRSQSAMGYSDAASLHSQRQYSESVFSRQGHGRTWSSIQLSDTASVYSQASQRPPLRHAASCNPTLSMCSAQPGAYVECNAQPYTTTAHSHYVPSMAASEYGIAITPAMLRDTSIAPMASNSSLESPCASGDYSSCTYTTDVTSIPGSLSPKPDASTVSSRVTIPLARTDGQRQPGVTSKTSHRSLRSQIPQTYQEQAAMEAHMNARSRQQSSLPMLQRSESVTSYATSNQSHNLDAASQPSLNSEVNRYKSTPARYRSGILHTIDTGPVRSSTSFIHLETPALRRQGSITPSIASSVQRPVSNSIIGATPPGGICGQNTMSRRGPFPKYALMHTQSQPQRSSANSAYKSDFHRRPVHHVPSFAGPLRSEKTAAVDSYALRKAEFSMFKAGRSAAREEVAELELQRLQVPRMHRLAPTVVHGQVAMTNDPSARMINPDTGLPHKTLYEQLEVKEVLDGKRNV